MLWTTSCPHARWSRARSRELHLLPSPPLSPSPAGRARGNALQGAPPCAPTPLSHAVGEGPGVRAKKVRLFPTRRTQVLYPYQLCPPLPRGGRGGTRCKAHRRAPLHPSPTAWERGWGCALLGAGAQTHADARDKCCCIIGGYVVMVPGCGRAVSTPYAGTGKCERCARLAICGL